MLALLPLLATNLRRGRPRGSRSSQPLAGPGPVTSSTLHNEISASTGVLYGMPSCRGRKFNIWAAGGGAAVAAAAKPHASRQPANRTPTRTVAIRDLLSPGSGRPSTTYFGTTGPAG